MSVAEISGLPPETLPEIAFAGRSNSGKSTTINVLTRQTRLAFSSKTPGRTQLLNFFELTKKNEEGVRAPVGVLVDLPGYGFARAAPNARATWDALVGGYVADRNALEGIVIVMDARRPFMPGDEGLIEFLSHRDIRLHLLLNKADQLKTMEKRAALKLAQTRCEQLGPKASTQLFSGLKREGVDELRGVLLSWLKIEETAPPVSSKK
ncbi:MAG: ribosome biogenesis GTP-binding protein YihA/YsxC [Burkholderiaceae bacterium]